MYLFLAISIGLGLGAGQVVVTGLAFALIVIVILLQGLFRRPRLTCAGSCVNLEPRRRAGAVK